MGKPGQRFSFRRNLSAFVLSAMSLLATAWVSVYTFKDAQTDARDKFEFSSDEIKLRIDTRMQAHAQILRSGAALFQASDEVTRREWRIYTMHQKVEQYLPGIQGIGFARLIHPDELEAHIQKVRAEGFPDYTVTPEGSRPIYTAIEFLEPFNMRNRRAFGYDMYSEPVRRKAMAQARDYDVAALSGRVTLLQETHTDIQAGTLMYVPVYKEGAKLDTVAHRRAALRGWVYSPYRMKDLMNGILRKREMDIHPGIRLEIFDASNLRKESLMYDSSTATSAAIDDSSMQTLLCRLNFNGHIWFLRFSSPCPHEGYSTVLSVALSGMLISVLLFGMVHSLLITRQKARQLADQLKVDAKLEKINLQLQKNESLHRMAGAIAHHFNNKLGAVLGNLELAIDDIPVDAPPRPRLESAMVAATSAAEISGQMLTYLGQTARSHTPHKLGDIVHASWPLLQTIAPKGVELILTPTSSNPTVCADMNQIQQILTNLTTNAFEAVGTHQGRVTISIREVAAVDVPAENRFPIDWKPTASSYALLEVADTGGGISKADFPILFDPFYSSRFTGRGLGLAAVLGIVRAHDGAVAVESVLCVGSVFRVLLPTVEHTSHSVSATALSPTALPEPPAVTELQTTKTVLFVEDEQVVREMAETMLHRLGYRVFSASDGEAAVEIFKQHTAEMDVVLCDLSMPKINGIDTMTAIRRIRPDIPVILASGHVESHAMDATQEHPPEAFLHKPYRKTDLKAALDQVLQKGKSA
ncbi:MAG: CHASE domain-containing protein [Deltaproteobacteria bacterium]|nr:CHASE domain-containing protein [Deltaproteobacteria bacterium]